MRVFASFITLALLLSVSEAAVLLRFINTVPTRFSGVASTYTAANARVLAISTKIDRVALGYVATGATAPTLLWTEAYVPGGIATTADTAADENGATATAANFAWTHAMPPLRAYHGTGTTDLTDTVTPWDTATPDLSVSTVDQTVFKADGVGLYLSLAAGTYTFGAYSVLGSATSAADTAVYGNSPTLFPTTKDSVFTFEDGKVYTLVALGDGKYSTTPLALTGTDVTLKLFEESTAPATYGMASVRFFHAIKSAKASTINVYLGDTTTTPLATAIAFGGLSSYIDLAPSSGQLFPITASSTPPTVIAPSTTGKKEVTIELRAGLRATIICATDNEVDQKVFCRTIPSRVVAYVRLINDMASSTYMHLGPVASQPLNKLNLTLWASSEAPRGDQLSELSQTGGTRSLTNHVLNIRGLYKVVTNVAPGTVSGYGEVFVPVNIMDFAIRYTVAIDNAEDLGTNAGTYAKQLIATDIAGGNLATYQWYLGGALVKRVHFIVRTSGGATLASNANTVAKLQETAGSAWTFGSILIEKFMDPGSYNSIFVVPNTDAATNAGLITKAVAMFNSRVDRTHAQVASGIPSGKGFVSAIQFAKDATKVQSFDQGVLNFRSGASVVSKTFAAATDEPAVALGAAATATPAFATDVVNKDPHFTLSAGDYTFDFTPKTTPDACLNVMPGVGSLSVKSGQAYDIFVFNTRACLAATRRVDASQLVVATAQQQSASATGNADGTVLVSSGTTTTTTTSTFYFAAASSVSMSISVVVAALFAIIAALL